MEIARGTDLPDLLASLGYTVTRIGRYYSTKEMDSLRIKNRRTWYRYSERVGGDAITFLQHFCGRSFPEAVEDLLAFHGRARDAPAERSRQTEQAPEPPKPFALPPRHTDARRVYAYLKKRGVSPQIIRSFISAGLLYEDSEHHNCVFVGYDRDGKAAFASLRGTYDRDGSGFKGDAAGSDKSIGFRLPYAPDSRTVYVFEAPIDLMSYCTLHREFHSNALALCCLDDRALSVFLREHPTVRKVVLCLDHDRPGQEAAERMGRKYAAEGYVVQTLSPPSRKDWNAYSCVELGKDDDTLEFFTAWSSVPTILEALSRKYPDQTISYCWADEDIGSNVGEAVYKNGEMIDANIPEPGSREAYELASDIMGIDLADFDLYLSADKSTYEYHEDPSKTKRTKDGPAR